MITTEELNRGFTLGDYEVLPAQGIIRKGDEVQEPEPKVMGVLMSLAMRDGDVVSQDELIAEVWDNRIFDNQPIQRCATLLRGHFDDRKRPYEYVGNLPRRGYRLLKPVELTADKLDQEQEADLPPRSDRRWKAVAAFVLIGFIAIVAAMIVWPIIGGKYSVNSVAILPLDNLTGDPALQYAVDGTKNSLAQQLSELDGIVVKNIHQQDNGAATAVAARLKVESILRGSMMANGDDLKVVYSIVFGEDGVIMSSGEVIGSVDDLFKLHRDLAVSVRDDIADMWAPQLITRPAPNRDAYRIFMKGMRALRNRGDGNNLEYSINFFQEAIEQDPEYGPPYLGLATALVLIPVPAYLGGDVETHHRRAIDTIKEGIQKDPSIEEAGGAIFGFVYHQQKRWQESEENYRRAVRAPFVDPNAFSSFARMLASVGRFDEALRIAQQGEELDPTGPIVASRIAQIYTWQGNNEKAHEFFKVAGENKATGILDVMAETLLLVREGKFDIARERALSVAQMQGSAADWIGPVFAAFQDPGQVGEGLAAINLAWENDEVIADIVLMVRTILGDYEGAMEIAEMLEGPAEPFATELLFIPETAALRRQPGFMPLLERLRIVEYWEEVGCRWEDDVVVCSP